MRQEKEGGMGLSQGRNSPGGLGERLTAGRRADRWGSEKRCAETHGHCFIFPPHDLWKPITSKLFFFFFFASGSCFEQQCCLATDLQDQRLIKYHNSSTLWREPQGLLGKYEGELGTWLFCSLEVSFKAPDMMFKRLGAVLRGHRWETRGGGACLCTCLPWRRLHRHLFGMSKCRTNRRICVCRVWFRSHERH